MFTLETLTEEQFECFIEYFCENYLEDYKSDLENLKEVYKMMNGGVEYPRTQNTSHSEIKELYEPSPRMYEQPSCLGSTFIGETLRKTNQLHQTFEKSSIEMTRKLDDMIELPKSQPKRTYNEDLECKIVLVKMPKCMAWLYDEPIEEVDETIGIPMEVEPLDHTQLEDLGLNTYVNLRGKRGTDPLINSYSPGNTRDLAHLEKKRTRLRLYTKSLKKLCIQSVETVSRVSSDGVRTFEATASEIQTNTTTHHHHHHYTIYHRTTTTIVVCGGGGSMMVLAVVIVAVVGDDDGGSGGGG
nr:hypothetical protein [Tanacetum cinerariifolium]